MIDLINIAFLLAAAIVFGVVFVCAGAFVFLRDIDGEIGD